MYIIDFKNNFFKLFVKYVYFIRLLLYYLVQCIYNAIWHIYSSVVQNKDIIIKIDQPHEN
jgi:hypothetical protein